MGEEKNEKEKKERSSIIGGGEVIPVIAWCDINGPRTLVTFSECKPESSCDLWRTHFDVASQKGLILNPGKACSSEDSDGYLGRIL